MISSDWNQPLRVSLLSGCGTLASSNQLHHDSQMPTQILTLQM